MNKTRFICTILYILSIAVTVISAVVICTSVLRLANGRLTAIISLIISCAVLWMASEFGDATYRRTH